MNKIIWETKEDKQSWREKEGWVSKEDFDQILIDMVDDFNEGTLRFNSNNESFIII